MKASLLMHVTEHKNNQFRENNMRRSLGSSHALYSSMKVRIGFVTLNLWRETYYPTGTSKRYCKLNLLNRLVSESKLDP